MIGNPRLQRLARIDTHRLDLRSRYWRLLSSWDGWRQVGMLLGFFAIAMIYVPLALLALMSISQSPLSGIPYPLTLSHYGSLLSDDRWLLPLQKSVIMGLVVAFTCMVVATLVGRAITRMRKPGGVLMVALIPLFVPGLTMGAALFIFLRTMLDLKLGLWSIFLAHMVWALPFALLLVLVVGSRFDLRLLEAASDLGANDWQRFWQIEFPILRPGILGAGIFGFLLSFNELLRSIFVRGQETTMPIYNWAMAASQQSQVPIIFALATIILLVTLPIMSVFFWLLFRKAS